MTTPKLKMLNSREQINEALERASAQPNEWPYYDAARDEARVARKLWTDKFITADTTWEQGLSDMTFMDNV